MERARRAAQGEVGRLTVGFVSGLAFGGLPEIVRRFRELQAKAKRGCFINPDAR